MPLHVSRDSYESKQVTLADLVDLCRDCTKYCFERTERLLSNRGHAPRGWEKEYAEVANERRSQDMDLCMSACTALPRSCPSVERLRAFEALDGTTPHPPTEAKQVEPKSSSGVLGLFRKSKSESAAPVVPLELPTTQELSRCGNAAEKFSRVLFAIAQKPSKVHFDNINPKTGEKAAEMDEVVAELAGVANASASTVKKEVAEATASVKKPLDKKTAHDEILKRWSTSRRERTNMEELGVIQTHDDTQRLKQELQLKETQAKQKADAGQSQGASSGTVPKW